jgi:hypothetical protein
VNETWSPWRRRALVVGIAACGVIAWIALILGRPVPVLALVNLGFHELGHLVTYPFPDLVTAVMVPASNELVATVLVLAWLLLLAGAATCAWGAARSRPSPVRVPPHPLVSVRPISWEG